MSTSINGSVQSQSKSLNSNDVENKSVWRRTVGNVTGYLTRSFQWAFGVPSEKKIEASVEQLSPAPLTRQEAQNFIDRLDDSSKGEFEVLLGQKTESPHEAAAWLLVETEIKGLMFPEESYEEAISALEYIIENHDTLDFRPVLVIL